MFGVNFSALDELKTLIQQILSVCDQDEGGNNRNGDNFRAILGEVHADQRETGDGKNAGQNGFSEHKKETHE